MEHEKLVQERVAEDHRTKRPRVQSKTPVQSEPTNPAEPTMSPNVGCSNATPTPSTPGPLPIAEEDSPVQPDLGEFLFFFLCRLGFRYIAGSVGLPISGLLWQWVQGLGSLRVVFFVRIGCECLSMLVGGLRDEGVVRGFVFLLRILACFRL
jgi:hypothetical protein